VFVLPRLHYPGYQCQIRTLGKGTEYIEYASQITLNSKILLLKIYREMPGIFF
jgi:hypothetical protein